jgi:hypothetical protein
VEKTFFFGGKMFSTEITTNMEDPKKSFDEISLARCCVMATESLNPEEFDNFLTAYNALIDRRRLQNEKISHSD